MHLPRTNKKKKKKKKKNSQLPLSHDVIRKVDWILETQ